ncbi:helix-turn-helix domain-containing protein [Pseudonocardia cypriaca]|uniref:Transcriptional regulator with XRE-family HTH domain n=1 Tax=Pseudonocardia cypriaca TaxID=882449 RepID=A0A543GBD2_9PSEU|nr:helix-turn-helix transcriptional regulator [Pseudonocardia cypriaca]TQM43382.1 transcriptional regulator with XRE-family HTH domain [Pseudonocardia cypriaca]
MTEPIGRRIAFHRRRRGLSQAAVAGLVGRSESWLSQVERGLRTVDSYSVLRDLARVLRVDIGTLTGSGSEPERSVCHSDLVAIERALLSSFANAPIADVGSAVPALHGAYQAAHYDEVLAALPGLVEALDGQEPQLVAAGYTVVAKTLTKIGQHDLALVAADRARTAAQRGGELADVGMAVYQVACALLPTARAPLAEELAVTTATELDGDSPAMWSVTGALWLIAAVAAARRIDAAAAEERLDRAHQLADRLGEDANHRWTAFGPTNVAIHRVSVAVELGDAPAALAAAEAVDLDRLPEGLRSRRVQVQLDIAWAQAQRRRDAEALVALLEIERAAPQVTRRNAVARDTIRQLLARARGTSGAAVRGLAHRAGVAV